MCLCVSVRASRSYQEHAFAAAFMLLRANAAQEHSLVVVQNDTNDAIGTPAESPQIVAELRKAVQQIQEQIEVLTLLLHNSI